MPNADAPVKILGGMLRANAMKRLTYLMSFWALFYTISASAEEFLVGNWVDRVVIPRFVREGLYDLTVNISSMSMYKPGSYLQMVWYKSGQPQKGEISELIPQETSYRFRVSREQRFEKLEIRVIGELAVEVRSVGFRKNPVFVLDQKFDGSATVDLLKQMKLTAHLGDNVVGIRVNGNQLAQGSRIQGDLHETPSYYGSQGVEEGSQPHLYLEVPRGAYIRTVEVELEVDPQRFFLEPSN